MNKTDIQWCDFSSNPIKAIRKSDGKKGWWCSHTSPGCERCYAETINNRFGNQVDYKAQNQNQIEFYLDEKELAQFAKVPAGKKVFVEDMSDLFHEGISDEMITRVLHNIRESKGIFQLLTKRIGRAKEVLTNYYWTMGRSRPYQNLWLGCSVEDQQRADERIPLLLQTPAAVRFISAEPLLGPIDLRLQKDHVLKLDWVIIGGESGSKARPCNIEWIRSIVRQCQDARVAVFVKQLGSQPYSMWGNTPSFLRRYSKENSAAILKDHTTICNNFESLGHSKGGDIKEFPKDLQLREFPL